jgi:hypothetical protein
VKQGAEVGPVAQDGQVGVGQELLTVPIRFEVAMVGGLGVSKICGADSILRSSSGSTASRGARSAQGRGSLLFVDISIKAGQAGDRRTTPSQPRNRWQPSCQR